MKDACRVFTRDSARTIFKNCPMLAALCEKISFLQGLRDVFIIYNESRNLCTQIYPSPVEGLGIRGSI